MMYTYGDHVSGWGYALGITSMILFWTLLALAITAVVRYLGRDSKLKSLAPPRPGPICPLIPPAVGRIP